MAKKKTQQEPQYYISKINTQVLNYNVYVMKASEKMIYSVLLFIVGGIMGLVYYGGLFKSEGKDTFATFISNIVVFCVVGLLAIKFFMPTINESLRRKRINKLKKQFCDFASALTNSLAAGMNMNDSLNAAYKDLVVQYTENALIVREVGEVLNGINNNIPVEQMLEDFGIRSGTDDIVNFAKVFATCYRTGGDIKSIVRRTTSIISDKIMTESEIETAITSNKMQMNVMVFLPTAVVVMTKFMSSDFAESYASVIGVIGLAVSIGLTFAAYKVGQKITDIKG